jgi:hypothetical protein
VDLQVIDLGYERTDLAREAVEAALVALDQAVAVAHQVLVTVLPLALGHLLGACQALHHGRLHVRSVAAQVAVVVRSEELGKASEVDLLLLFHLGDRFRRPITPLVVGPAKILQMHNGADDVELFFPLGLRLAVDLGRLVLQDVESVALEVVAVESDCVRLLVS